MMMTIIFGIKKHKTMVLSFKKNKTMVLSFKKNKTMVLRKKKINLYDEFEEADEYLLKNGESFHFD